MQTPENETPTTRELAERIKHLRQIVDERKDSSEVALKKASDVLDAWKAQSNEFRSALSDARSTTMPRPEINSELGRITQRIDAHEKLLNSMTGRAAGFGISWQAVLSVIALAIALYSALHVK